MALRIEGLCPLLQVFDMRSSVSFYWDVLGFEVVDSAPAGDDWDWVWLRSNGADLMLNTAYEAPHRPEAPDPRRVAAHSDTALFIGCPDVDGAYDHLVARWVDVEPPTIAPYGMKQSYVRDPEGDPAPEPLATFVRARRAAAERDGDAATSERFRSTRSRRIRWADPSSPRASRSCSR